MKICILPDVHENWDIFNKNLENALNDKSLDKIIVLGDYCDCHDTDKNIKNHGIVTAKNIKNLANIDDSRLDRLVGNHDFKYIAGFPCSGPSDYYKWLETYKEAFLSNLYKFKIAVKYDNWVFSHAGFSRTWFENVYNTFKLRFGIDNPLPNDPVDLSNMLFWSKHWKPFDFSDRCIDPYGDSIFSPPTWIRPDALLRSSYYENQVVGHTETYIEEPLFIREHNTNLIILDSPSHSLCYILDTKNPPKFLSAQENARIIKNKEKEILKQKSIDGEKYKRLRDKYNISKSDMNIIKAKVRMRQEDFLLKNPNKKFDWWEQVELECSSKK